MDKNTLITKYFSRLGIKSQSYSLLIDNDYKNEYYIEFSKLPVIFPSEETNSDDVLFIVVSPLMHDTGSAMECILQISGRTSAKNYGYITDDIKARFDSFDNFTKDLASRTVYKKLSAYIKERLREDKINLLL